jgi:hypothetical protein
VAVEISNEPAVSALCVTAERDGWDQLIVAVGDNVRRDWDRERPDRDERAAMRMQINQFTLPPEAILIWRMHGIVVVVLANLGAGATGARSPRSTCTARQPRRRWGRPKPRSSPATVGRRAPLSRPPTRHLPTA